jgi:hypothetical protein
MNNENKIRIESKMLIKTVWFMINVMIITALFTTNNSAQAQMKEVIVYNKNILYINKYNNLVNIKDIIYIDYINNNNKEKTVKHLYFINDLHSRTTFLMPEYSKKLNIKNDRVDHRVVISRLANGIKSVETGGATAYHRKSYSSSACGAYQYMPSTWDNYMGYKSACDAPGWVQDARIIHELEYNYKKYGDWEKVVASHLMPSRAGNPKTWNKPISGNPTVAHYVNSVFDKANLVSA